VAPSERQYVAQLPGPLAGGSPLALEVCVLMAVLRAVKPERVFEFGTYLGDTTCLFARNLSGPGGVVYTLDLDTTESIEFEGNDASLAHHAVAAERSFEGLGAEVVQLSGDSYKLDLSPYEDRMGLVFVDGNHAPKYVERDTANALRMVVPGGPSAVLWHDYGNVEYPAVKQCLDALSVREPLFHVEETMIVVRLRGLDLPERQS
jgi:hypothetical protein